jgi:Phosphodiester glycosidase
MEERSTFDRAVGPGESAPPRPRYWRRRAAVAGALVAVVMMLLVGASVIGAATTPGNEDFSAKWADWLRAHDASFMVNPVEQWYYTRQAPRAGGRPRQLNAVPTTERTTTRSTRSASAGRVGPGHLAPPAAVHLLVTPALPHEGQWNATGPPVDGGPGMYVAQFRADTIYTSQITSAVWIDPTRLRIDLVAGAREPGGTWTTPPFVGGADLAHVVAAFNGGFRFQDAHGGFYLDGQTAVPLRAGAASLVLYRDHHVAVGLWNRDVSMTPEVTAVLQNLVLLVDAGHLDPSASYTDTKIWGHTLGANTVVARSGIGVTASGALVYVAGPALTAKTLAESLQRAGAIRAMTLDINPEWVTFNLFEHPDPANLAIVTGSKLYPQIQRSARRYLGPTRESRDFFAVYTQ